MITHVVQLASSTNCVAARHARQHGARLQPLQQDAVARKSTTTSWRGYSVVRGRMAQLCGMWGSWWCVVAPVPTLACRRAANLPSPTQAVVPQQAVECNFSH